MEKASFILSALLLSGLLIPQGALGASINSPEYGGKESSGTKKVQYIRPPKKAERRRTVTPYGDFCSRCSKYGTGSKPVNINDAIVAIKHYFKTKGLDVKKVRGRGRFLKAEIYKGDHLVDRVLFDRRTGRIRSIY
jgi:hypothetical protein